MPHRGLTLRRRREGVSPFEWPPWPPHSHRLGLSESRRESPMCLPRTTARMEWPHPHLFGAAQMRPARLASPHRRTRAMPPLRPPTICLDTAQSKSRAAASERAEPAGTNASPHRPGTALRLLPRRRRRACTRATGLRATTIRAAPVSRVCRAESPPARAPGNQRSPPSQSTIHPLIRPRQGRRSGSEMRFARMRRALSATRLVTEERSRRQRRCRTTRCRRVLPGRAFRARSSTSFRYPHARGPRPPQTGPRESGSQTTRSDRRQ